MPNYDFVDRRGKRHIKYFEISEAPEYDEWMEVDGVEMRRVVSPPVIAHVPNYACVIKSQARHDPDYPRVNEVGNGVILNKREHQEYAAKKRGILEWD